MTAMETVQLCFLINTIMNMFLIFLMELDIRRMRKESAL